MSDQIPLPSENSVDLEVLRSFRADYEQLQYKDEKKVLLRMKDIMSAHLHRLKRIYNAIGLEGRCVMPLDDQMVIQLEWAFHDVRLDGQTIISRTAANPPDLSPKALRALQNRPQGRYSVYRLNNLAPELGVEFEDMVFGGKFAVLDLPTAEKRKPGELMATRIFWTGEYWTHSSGRFFIKPELLPRVRQRVIDSVGESSYENLTPAQRSQVATEVIRTCAENMPTQNPAWGVLNKYKKQYQNKVSAGLAGHAHPPQRLGAIRIGRNDPCPCGSGKKYKHCCCGSN
jgi:hypothetical protein